MTHKPGTWVECMRNGGCETAAEHDLRDEVARLRFALDEALEWIAAIPGGMLMDGGVEELTTEEVCEKLRAIAEGRA